MFAFRDGVLDLRSLSGGICHKGGSAYAIILKHNEETNSEATPGQFSYKTKQQNPGFHSLTAHSSRNTACIRVFRTNSLSSVWAPVAGIRYDGLYARLIRPLLRALMILDIGSLDGPSYRVSAKT